MNEQSNNRSGPGNASYFNEKGYANLTEHLTLTSIKKGERIFRPLVYIASPYSSDVGRNTKRARKYCRFAVQQNAIPFAPHLLLPQYMNDENEEERELVFFMNMVFLGKCSQLWVFGSKITEGMQREIDWATKRQKSIRYFTEEMQEVKV